MGKKSKHNKDAKHSKHKHEEDAIISSLLNKTSTLPGSNAKQCWNEHTEIRELVQKLDQIQNHSIEGRLQSRPLCMSQKRTAVSKCGHTSVRRLFLVENTKITEFRAVCINSEEISPRSDLIPRFHKWLTENGAEHGKVTVFATSESDCGVKSVVDVKEGEQILSIPRNLILSSENTPSTVLGSIVEKDKMLRIMPNVVLALKLLQERHKDDSFWKPYIDVLPRTFTTPLFFSLEEMRVLQGSQVLDSALNLYKSISRQYAYLHQIFKRIPEAKNMKFIKSFSFSEYRWAVSIVMTRQNQIPSTSGQGSHLALIPLLDMCNHMQGQITTDYDLGKNACVCFALNSCVAGDQVFIFYGPRSNSDFFLHSGFYYEENNHDVLPLKLGISKSDSLYTTKTQLLVKLGLEIKNIGIIKAEFPLTNELLAFLRIFSIDEDEGARLLQETEESLAQLLYNPSCHVSAQNEEKVWSFLEMRCSLILRQYPGTREEDDEALKTKELSENVELATKVCRGEKLLLTNVIAFCKMKKERRTEDK